MKTMTLKTAVIAIIFLVSHYLVSAQCSDPSTIYSFVYNGKTYEVVKENKTWVDAALCAVERGGILIEINDVSEQNAIYTELTTLANITVSNTVAPDGGGGSYVWIGGNDLSMEGNWVWNGNNDSNSTPFWMGTASGNPVGGLYNNWGNEPDDFGGQDALGLSLNGWPLGSAGQWNDVNHNNTLYYVIEYASVLSMDQIDFQTQIKLFPNPVVDFLNLETNGINVRDIVILNSFGQIVKRMTLEEGLTSVKIDLSHLNRGIYFIKMNTKNGTSILKKIIK